jgi:hypothetical protein
VPCCSSPIIPDRTLRNARVAGDALRMSRTVSRPAVSSASVQARNPASRARRHRVLQNRCGRPPSRRGGKARPHQTQRITVPGPPCHAYNQPLLINLCPGKLPLPIAAYIDYFCSTRALLFIAGINFGSRHGVWRQSERMSLIPAGCGGLADEPMPCRSRPRFRPSPSTVSLVLIKAQLVDPKPPINSLQVYRNLLLIRGP